ncbi:MAG: transglutaminase family protein [Clostridia bacterium]|nr:transglutaminase family protein [Clostridia bacterium]
MKRRVLLCLMLALLVTAAGAVWGTAAMGASAKWPVASGKSVKKNGKLKVDASNINQGYFMASLQKKSSKKMKLRVVKGKESLTYDLNGKGDYEVFPFQYGSGKYEISLWENVSGKKYSAAGKVTLTVKLKDDSFPFLYPNQYVDYTKASEAVKKAGELCEGKKTADAYKAVQDFMTNSFVYDYVKAVTVKAGVLPDIDGTYKKKMGVCQDLSAIMVCMLRTQGIPAKLVIGYVDKNYHAWTTATVNGKEIFFDPTAALNAISAPKDYSTERYY